MKRIPIIPTLFVLAAAATMVGLGIWQLGRADEKAALIAQYEAALEADPIGIPFFPYDEELRRASLFRRTQINCEITTVEEPRAGKNVYGANGWMQINRCLPEGTDTSHLFEVAIGWSLTPQPVHWRGGEVTGWIVPGSRINGDPEDSFGLMLRAENAMVDGLVPLAPPDPNSLPNNHISYAVQWFFFALTALVIYWLALRSRMAKRD